MTTDVLDVLASLRSSVEYMQEEAKLGFATQLLECMSRSDINQRNLAKKVDKSEAYISKALRGDANLTMETMVALAYGCDAKFHFRLAGSKSAMRWIEMIHCGVESKIGKAKKNVWSKSMSLSKSMPLEVDFQIIMRRSAEGGANVSAA